MAGAKLKEGLDYYPTTTRIDRGFRIIKALHGADGYVILDFLLKDIYGERGYYMKWNDRMAKFFASEYGFNFETVKAVVEECLYEGILDKEKFSEYGILTSKEIQDVWIHVAKERKVVIHVKEYLMIDIQPYLKTRDKISPVYETDLGDVFQGLNTKESAESISPGINCKNPPDNRQSKVKQSIAKRSEAKKSEVEENEVKKKKEKETEFFKKEISEANFFSLSANISPLKKRKEFFYKKKIEPPDIKLEKPAEREGNSEKGNFSKKEIPDVAPGNSQITGLENPKKAEVTLTIELPCEEHTEKALNKQSVQKEHCCDGIAVFGEALGKTGKRNLR